MSEKLEVIRSLLRREAEAPEVYRALQELKRTGWVMRDVANPESVKEHTHSLLHLATELLPRLTEAEQHQLLDMLEIHDWPEAIHGDEVILELVPDQRKALKDIKFEKELAALRQICATLPNG